MHPNAKMVIGLTRVASPSGHPIHTASIACSSCTVNVQTSSGGASLALHYAADCWKLHVNGIKRFARASQSPSTRATKKAAKKGTP
jgi:hypothetical protein